MSFRKCWNHLGWERTLTSATNLSYSVSLLNFVPFCCIHMSLKYLEGWRLHIVPSQPFSVLDNCLHEKNSYWHPNSAFSGTTGDHFFASFRFLPEKRDYHPTHFSLSGKRTVRCPWSPLFSSLNSPSSFSNPHLSCFLFFSPALLLFSEDLTETQCPLYPGLQSQIQYLDCSLISRRGQSFS